MVVAATGMPIRELATQIKLDRSLPDGFSDPRIVIPGVMAVQAPRFHASSGPGDVQRFVEQCEQNESLQDIPLITLVDDSQFASTTLNNWLWSTFTRSNPAIDIQGIDAITVDKHWGCRGPLVIDARTKSHHAPPLIENRETIAKVDARASRGGPLARYL